jgi:hypothetical protein
MASLLGMSWKLIFVFAPTLADKSGLSVSPVTNIDTANKQVAVFMSM